MVRYPWKRVLTNIKTRCNNKNATQYKYYGGKGIKCLITEEEIKELWFRDKAYLMKNPSIDRENSNLNYTFNNCRFIEININTQRTFEKIILQYDLKDNFIKKWDSTAQVVKELNIIQQNISSVARGLRKQAGGFKWKYHYAT